jgi:alpha/beta superfamily hydrolase
MLIQSDAPITGMGAQKDMGLHQYAASFVTGGLAALVFDYRTFGGSDGEPRQWVSPSRHVQDWQSAVDYVKQQLDGQVDCSRMCLWGTSFAGGHVLVTAANNTANVVAVVSQVMLAVCWHLSSEVKGCIVGVKVVQRHDVAACGVKQYSSCWPQQTSQLAHHLVTTSHISGQHSHQQSVSSCSPRARFSLLGPVRTSASKLVAFATACSSGQLQQPRLQCTKCSKPPPHGSSEPENTLSVAHQTSSNTPFCLSQTQANPLPLLLLLWTPPHSLSRRCPT